jgi:UDP-N-acetyl-2-amino-2-deoxyglucuronate dehydrogenase
MENINFALIGCGRVAKKYIEVFRDKLIQKGRIVSVCDINFERAKEAGEILDVPAYSDMHHMMAEQGNRIQALILLTESGLHAELTLNLAPYGKHLIVEKPITLTLEDADKMILACKKKNIRLFVVHQNRYNLSVQKLREVYDQGHFGKIVMGTARMRWCRTQDYYDQTAWHGTRKGEGGLFLNQAIHYLDLLTWFLGEPLSVYAKSRCALVDIETEDTGIAVITFKNGALGVIEATTAARPCDIEGSFSLLGEKGMAEIDGFALNKMRHWHFSTSHPDLKIAVEDFSESPPNVYGFGHIRYLNHVVDELQGNPHGLPEGLEGRKSLELAVGIYRSIEKGKEILFKNEWIN